MGIMNVYIIVTTFLFHVYLESTQYFYSGKDQLEVDCKQTTVKKQIADDLTSISPSSKRKKGLFTVVSVQSTSS